MACTPLNHDNEKQTTGIGTVLHAFAPRGRAPYSFCAEALSDSHGMSQLDQTPKHAQEL